jgi:hypothetical protein
LIVIHDRVGVNCMGRLTQEIHPAAFLKSIPVFTGILPPEDP